MVEYQQVVDRLGQFGIAEEQIDTAALQFDMTLILQYVVNYCNLDNGNEIPEILDLRIIDRICSEYHIKKKNAGLLEGFDYEQAVKTIKEGDTQIQFASEADGTTPEERFNKLVDYLYKGFDKWICKYRKIRW